MFLWIKVCTVKVIPIDREALSRRAKPENLRNCCSRRPVRAEIVRRIDFHWRGNRRRGRNLVEVEYAGDRHSRQWRQYRRRPGKSAAVWSVLEPVEPGVVGREGPFVAVPHGGGSASHGRLDEPEAIPLDSSTGVVRRNLDRSSIAVFLGSDPR